MQILHEIVSIIWTPTYTLVFAKHYILVKIKVHEEYLQNVRKQICIKKLAINLSFNIMRCITNTIKRKHVIDIDHKFMAQNFVESEHLILVTMPIYYVHAKTREKAAMGSRS